MTSQFSSPTVPLLPWHNVDTSALAFHPFGLYIHVPFCTSRCGYCDFTTYTLKSYPGDDPLSDWVETWGQELRCGIEQARTAGLVIPPINTVFVGGGTPSLLGARMNTLMHTIRDVCDMAPDVEITCEANPESTSQELFDIWAAAGVNRISLGMQSSSQHVLRVLERKHSPRRAVAAIAEAQAAGFQHLNLDLIYGTPGETYNDLRSSVDTVLETGVDHVSAYALTVEPGTALYRKMAHGQVPCIDDDDEADRYYFVDDLLQEAGFQWYEISNWARHKQSRCRHNLGYWQGGNWWASGPGAHGYLGGVRWSIMKNPRRYGGTISSGMYPVEWYETLTPLERWEERMMLGLRVAEGLPRDDVLKVVPVDVVEHYIQEELLQWGIVTGEKSGKSVNIQLTTKGRMMADGIVRDILCAVDNLSTG